MFLVSEAIDISAFTVLGPSLFLELVFVIFISQMEKTHEAE